MVIAILIQAGSQTTSLHHVNPVTSRALCSVGSAQGLSTLYGVHGWTYINLTRVQTNSTVMIHRTLTGLTAEPDGLTVR